MSDFAKIVVIDGEQVLFYTEPDPDDETKTKLNQIVQANGVVANIAVGGISDDSGLLDKCGFEAARNVLDVVRQFTGEQQ